MGKFSIRPHYELLPPYNTYFGGKSGEGVYQTIIGQMPPHHIYCEPLAGSAAIFRRKAPAQVSLLGDLDQPLMLAHARALAATQPNPAMQLQAVEESLAMSGDSLAHFALMRNSCPSPSNSGQTAGVHYLTADWTTLAELGEGKLRESEQNRKPLSLLTYFDPPYPPQTRKGHDRYKYEFTHSDHVRLLRHIKQMPGMVMVSTYPNDLYRDELADWRLVVFQAKTRGGVATEWLFCNFDEPTHLHDYRYLGDDYRIRENVKNRKKNLLTEFGRLPTLQRHALLASLMMAVPGMAHVPMPGGKRTGSDPLPAPTLVEALDGLPADDLVVAMETGMDWSEPIGDIVPDQSPVAAAWPDVAELPDGMAWLVGECPVCQRRTQNQKLDNPAKFQKLGYEPVANRVWLERRSCTTCQTPASPDDPALALEVERGKGNVYHRCHVCKKQRWEQRVEEPAKFERWGWVKMSWGVWADMDWTCSAACTQQAQLRDAAVPVADAVGSGSPNH